VLPLMNTGRRRYDKQCACYRLWIPAVAGMTKNELRAEGME